MRILPLGILFLLASAGLRAQTLQAAFDQIDRASQSFRSMSAEISRVMHTAVINDNTNDNGTMTLKRSKKDTKMLIRFTGPEAKTVALDGDTFRIFYPKTNTVQYWNIGQNRNLVDQFLLLGFGATKDELQKSYSVSFAGDEKIDGQATSHLVLVPKSQDVLKKLKQAELWISQSKGVPLRQKFVTSSDGDSTQVTYSNLKLNPNLSDNDLQLKEPKGAHREYPQK